MSTEFPLNRPPALNFLRRNEETRTPKHFDNATPKLSRKPGERALVTNSATDSLLATGGITDVEQFAGAVKSSIQNINKHIKQIEKTRYQGMKNAGQGGTFLTQLGQTDAVDEETASIILQDVPLEPWEVVGSTDYHREVKRRARIWLKDQESRYRDYLWKQYAKSIVAAAASIDDQYASKGIAYHTTRERSIRLLKNNISRKVQLAVNKQSLYGWDLDTATGVAVAEMKKEIKLRADKRRALQGDIARRNRLRKLGESDAAATGAQFEPEVTVEEPVGEEEEEDEIPVSEEDPEVAAQRAAAEEARRTAAEEARRAATALAEQQEAAQNGLRKLLKSRGSAPSAEEMAKIVELDLGGLASGTNGVKAFSQVFDKCSSLEVLDMSANDLGANSLSMLLETIIKATKVNLNTLDLSANSLGGGASTGPAAICAFLDNETRYKRYRLQNLVLRNCHIGSGGCHVFGDTVARSETLVHLNLSENGIGDAGARPLAEMLAVAKSLKTLDLSFNDIGERGAFYIAKAIKGRAENASANDLSPKSLERRAKGKVIPARAPSQLVALDLSWNEIGDRAGTSLAVAAKHSPTLAELAIASCMIGDETAFALADAIDNNPVLRLIMIDNNDFSVDAGKAIVNAVRRSRTFQALGRDGCVGIKHVLEPLDAEDADAAEEEQRKKNVTSMTAQMHLREASRGTAGEGLSPETISPSKTPNLLSHRSGV